MPVQREPSQAAASPAPAISIARAFRTSSAIATTSRRTSRRGLHQRHRNGRVRVSKDARSASVLPGCPIRLVTTYPRHSSPHRQSRPSRFGIRLKARSFQIHAARSSSFAAKCSSVPRPACRTSSPAKWLPRLSAARSQPEREPRGLCVTCHNPNQTDVPYRSARRRPMPASADLKRRSTSRYMVHSIHAGGVPQDVVRTS